MPGSAHPERRPPSEVKEIAELLGVHRNTIMRWIASGDLAATRLGRRYFVPAAEVDRILGEATGDAGTAGAA